MTVTNESTTTVKAAEHCCEIEDAGGRCISSATLWICNTDSNEAEADSAAKRTCGHHTDRAFQVVGQAGGTHTPEFRVIPLGALAERISAHVPVQDYVA